MSIRTDVVATGVVPGPDRRVPHECMAAMLVEPQSPLEVQRVPVPDRLQPGGALVKIDVATVCGTDLHVAGDGRLASGALPMILGHEMVGRIVELEDVDADSVGEPLAVGDRIIWAHATCGACYECVVAKRPMLCRDRRRYGGQRSTDYPYLTGGFAEYCYVYPTAGRLKVPDELSDGAASAASCALRTVIAGFDRLGPVRDDEVVLIQGSGPLGLFATACAAVSGARKIIVVGGPRNRLALAAEWGATDVLDVMELDASGRLSAVLDMTAGQGPDIVIEVSGARTAVPEGMALLRRGGRYLVIGQGRPGDVPFDPSLIVSKHATLIGSLSGGIDHYWRALQFMIARRDRFDWDRMISGEFSLDRVNDAFAGMADGSEIKPAIVLGDAWRPSLPAHD